MKRKGGMIQINEEKHRGLLERALAGYVHPLELVSILVVLVDGR